MSKPHPESATRSSLVSDAYSAIKAAIRDNRLTPGYHGSEQELATQFGMSRTPVHDAVIRLQEEGLLRLIPKRGVFVTVIADSDIDEIYDVLVGLEGVAARRLASLPGEQRDDALGNLRDATSRMRAALADGDLDRWAQGDEAFHRALVENCGNARIVRIVETVSDQAHRARMLTLRLRPLPEKAAAEHDAIIAAIAAGDGAAAAAAAGAHREAARAIILPLLAAHGFVRPRPLGGQR
ncbi:MULTISPECIES: GntR family transcriptional regulator [unclassified Chelatococcus]|uniref:GntR family transcriptional regulator n=1 Tax=unclassified Chelatococcus TaxID=2638111 RepID=UPI001BD05A51|nr:MULTISPECIES: GntR family transcriptional regulator [unclassified Chelatococcus]MBS7699656.1 GntR family transcriptional regulator [Chelatococcus sp. YT9]MBX3557146.1 GntR family transcriptional regulator [Chelatococcus sp.]